MAELETNIGVVGAQAAANVVQGDGLRYLGRAPAGSFDIVFLDPPFADDRLADVCRLIDEVGLLAPGGRIYLEQDRAKPGIGLPGHWTPLRDKTAGNVRYMLVEVTA